MNSTLQQNHEEYATTTAKDYAILAQRAVSDTPKIIDFTKQVAPTQHGVTYYTYNHSLEGGNMSLEGTDGLKTGSSDVADYNHAITTKRDGLRIYQIILGAGDYEYLGGEKERNKIGNSLMNNAFNQYKRIKIFSEGVHTINDKKYYVSQDFYDILPVNMTKKDVKYVIEDDRLHIDYERTFISDAYGPPTVKLEQPIIKASKTRVLSLWESHPILTIALGTGIIIVLAVILKWLFKRVRK
ncbi:hypothetical protein CD133_10315 [Staphylococcus massiliensis CCUG 55927]|nr:hypothetical protein CD133_10315 [Staphylococcus massiliensis CCUG 55927]